MNDMNDGDNQDVQEVVNVAPPKRNIGVNTNRNVNNFTDLNASGSLNRYFMNMEVAGAVYKIPQTGRIFVHFIDRSGIIPFGLEISVGSQDNFVPMVPGRIYRAPATASAWVRVSQVYAGQVAVAVYVGAGDFEISGNESVTTVGWIPPAIAAPGRAFSPNGSASPLAVISHGGNNAFNLFSAPALGSAAGIMGNMPAIDAAAGANFWASVGSQATIIAAGTATLAAYALSAANFLTFWAKIYVSLNCTTSGQVILRLRVNGVTISERRFYMIAGTALNQPLFDELLSGAGADTQNVDVTITSNVLWAGDGTAQLQLTAR